MMNPKPGSQKWGSFSKYLKELSGLPKQASEDVKTTSRFHERHISWLYFNDRVLSEAADPSVPPLERLKFTAIVSSNLDEFFMVRVGELVRTAKRSPQYRFPSGLTASRVLGQVREHVLRQKSRQAAVFKDVLSALKKAGVHILADFSGEDAATDQEISRNLPELSFVLRKSSDPLPYLQSDRIHVFVRFPGEYAILSPEDRASRIVRLSGQNGIQRFALLERWLCAKAARFFPGRDVIEAFPFKIIRDADFKVRPSSDIRDAVTPEASGRPFDDDSIETRVVEAVNRRTRARVVRMEVDAPAYSDGALYLAAVQGLDSAALYRFDLPLDLRSLMSLYGNLKDCDALRYPPVQSVVPRVVQKSRSIFETIRVQDILLHHPYDSFDVIVKFLETAARDPDVTRIYLTIYRTSRESPIMEALKEAVRRGKKVTAYVEIKARFDELNNVRWATELRHHGVKVVQPMGDFKVHCKLTQVLRREDGEEVSYLHLGTGNYHPGTARQYTDLGLLTRDPDLGREISSYFESMANRSLPPVLRDLMVAPHNLHKQFLKLIREETAIQKSGGKGRIIAKMNSLVDPAIIEALYEASSAGVKVDLIVRGTCCLKTGIKGMSENIRVTSIVDRFLEHSRIYYFRSNGDVKIYLSSADWMPRNFHSRYEIAFPVKDPVLKAYIRQVILATSLADNSKAWALNPDGTYRRVKPAADGKNLRSQDYFEALSREHYLDTLLSNRPSAKAALQSSI